jgi:hypothetical protein
MDVLWADAELESLTVDYEAARLSVRETTGRVVTVVAKGVIGVDFLGLWDEVVVERAAIESDDAFSRECQRRIEERLGRDVADSGSPERNSRRFSTLTLTFIDGATLRLAAASYDIA